MKRSLNSTAQSERPDWQLGQAERHPIPIGVGEPSLTHIDTMYLTSRQELRIPPHLEVPARRGSSLMMKPRTHLHTLNTSPEDDSVGDSDSASCEVLSSSPETSPRCSSIRDHGSTMSTTQRFPTERFSARLRIPARLTSSALRYIELSRDPRSLGGLQSTPRCHPRSGTDPLGRCSRPSIFPLSPVRLRPRSESQLLR